MFLFSYIFFFFSSRRRHTRCGRDWSSDVCSSDLIGRGTNYGKVWMLTALAQTKTGARAMAQLEVASPVIGYASDGGFGLLGPNPTIGQMPNSNNFTANGNDANSCGGTAQPPHPGITGYDDPNASPPTNSVQTITNSLPRPDHYIGAGVGDCLHRIRSEEHTSELQSRPHLVCRL